MSVDSIVDPASPPPVVIPQLTVNGESDSSSCASSAVVDPETSQFADHSMAWNNALRRKGAGPPPPQAPPTVRFYTDRSPFSRRPSFVGRSNVDRFGPHDDPNNNKNFRYPPGYPIQSQAIYSKAQINKYTHVYVGGAGAPTLGPSALRYPQPLSAASFFSSRKSYEHFYISEFDLQHRASRNSSAMADSSSGTVSTNSSSHSNSISCTTRKTLIDSFIDRNEEYWHTRVTLKIDVAYTDHSHIIGKNGRNTQQVMKETGCHIHFPDSNRNPELEKSNMVSIAGPISSVEKARQALRKLSPLVVSMEMKTYIAGTINIMEMNEDVFVQELSATYSLNISIRQNKSSGQPFATFKGSAYQEANMKQAVLRFQQHYMNTNTAVCSTSLEILPSQQASVIGTNNVNICIISQISGATIHHPKSENVGATTFFVQGTLESILSARKHLIGCLPISLMFEVNESSTLPAEVKEVQQQQNEISINLRPKKTGETRQSIVIKAAEYQLTSVYAVKQRLSNDAKENNQITCSDYDFMHEFSNLYRLSSTTVYPSLFAAPVALTPMLVNTPLSITSPLLTGLPTPFFSDGSMGEVFTFPCITPQSAVLPNFPDAGNGIQTSLTRSTTSFNNADNSPIDPSTKPMQPSEKSNRPELSKPDAAFSQAEPLAAGLLHAAKKIQENADGWKAPGAAISDYSRQKILATKAMREKPVGARTPNDCWSGFGFSRSTPAETFRKNIQISRFLAANKESTTNGGVGGSILEKIGENSEFTSTNQQNRQLLLDNRSPFSTASTATMSDDLDEQAVSLKNAKSGAAADSLLEDEDEDKIGPWVVEKKVLSQNRRFASNNKALNATSYFDFVNVTRDEVSYSDIDDLATLLTNLQLSKYIDIFREQEIDTKTFLTMNDEDLKELGVNTFGARRKMVVAISEIKKRRMPFTS